MSIRRCSGNPDCEPDVSAQQSLVANQHSTSSQTLPSADQLLPSKHACCQPQPDKLRLLAALHLPALPRSCQFPHFRHCMRDTDGDFALRSTSAGPDGAGDLSVRTHVPADRRGRLQRPEGDQEAPAERQQSSQHTYVHAPPVNCVELMTSCEGHAYDVCSAVHQA